VRSSRKNREKKHGRLDYGIKKDNGRKHRGLYWGKGLEKISEKELFVGRSGREVKGDHR